MFKRVLDFLGGRAAPEPTASPADLELAVAALLVEAARMDNKFDAAERATIERLLAQKYSLTPEALNSLIVDAERAVHHSTQLFSFTREICNKMSADARVQLIEMLWKVAYSDGTLDAHEDMLVRRVAGLISVPDRERILARQTAIEKLAIAKDPPGAS